jgi:hypothetical protein
MAFYPSNVKWRIVDIPRRQARRAVGLVYSSRGPESMNKTRPGHTWFDLNWDRM